MAHIQKRAYKSKKAGKTTVTWQARYVGSDGKERSRRFNRQVDAQAWLDVVGGDLATGKWVDPEAGKILFRDFARQCLAGRRLRSTTRSKYEHLLDDHIVPTLGDFPIAKVTPAMVRAWHTPLAKRHASTAAGAYRLLASIFRVAVDDEILVRSPCRLKGAGRERSPERPTASITELDAGVAACPAHFQLAPLLAAWCQLRRGEILGLQRQDIDVTAALAAVRKSWCLQHDGRSVLGPPKTEAGIRIVNIPPNVLPTLRTHMESVGLEPTAWLFPGEKGQPASPRTLDRVWAKARKKIGRPDLRFHDLRHTGLTLAAIAGATTAELMRRAGHSSPAAAIRYQHATTDRDRALAQALGDLAESANIIALRRTNDGRNRDTRGSEQTG